MKNCEVFQTLPCLLGNKLVYHTFLNTATYRRQYFPGDSDGKESACNAGDLGSILDQGDPLEKGMATHSSILACCVVGLSPEPVDLCGQWVGGVRIHLDCRIPSWDPKSQRFVL